MKTNSCHHLLVKGRILAVKIKKAFTSQWVCLHKIHVDVLARLELAQSSWINTPTFLGCESIYKSMWTVSWHLCMRYILLVFCWRGSTSIPSSCDSPLSGVATTRKHKKRGKVLEHHIDAIMLPHGRVYCLKFVHYCLLVNCCGLKYQPGQAPWRCHKLQSYIIVVWQLGPKPEIITKKTTMRKGVV